MPDSPAASLTSSDDLSLVTELQSILDEAVVSGEECGCQLTVFRHGQLLARLCAGFSDARRTRPVSPNTLFPIFSAGKGIMTTAFHRLVEQGLIDYDRKIADLWPEFAGQGREDIQVWHVLSHRSGMHLTPPTQDLSELADWPKVCRRLTTMPPADTPGGKCHYHGLTYAWLLGETASRAAGMPFAQVIQEQVIQPLGMQQEIFFGLPLAAEWRAASLDSAAFIGPVPWAQDFISREGIRRGFIPSANGFATATAIARHYAALLSHVTGVRLLQPGTVAQVTKLCRHPQDLFPPGGTWAKFGLGYVLAGTENDLGQIFGQGGAGGAEGLTDKKTGLALGFTKNKLTPSHPIHPVRDRLAKALGLPIRHW